MTEKRQCPLNSYCQKIAARFSDGVGALAIGAFFSAVSDMVGEIDEAIHGDAEAAEKERHRKPSGNVG